MKLREIASKYEMLVPKVLAEEWDNVGLLLGDEDMEVSKVLTAIELTYEVLDYAIKNDFDLVFVHHPLIFTSISRITKDSTGEKIKALIKNDIALYVSHTNIDNYEFGLNHFFLEKIGATNIVKSESGVFFGEVNFDNGSEFAEYLKKILRLSCINFIGDIESEVKKIGVVTGSGMSFISDEILREVDVFLTGDVKYHQAMDVLEKNGRLIDITHYASEFISGELFERILKSQNEDIFIESYNNFNNPFKMI